MTDLWSFLLQTLTASGAAALLLALKALFRDKLSPRWQFASWGILALVLLLPAGRGGRYVLVNWPLLVELARSALTGAYGALARVTAPVPLPAPVPPRSPAEWLYAVYVLGAVFFLGRYLLAYVRLRRALRRGRPAEDSRVRETAEKYGLPACPALEAEGLPTAFVCGVLRPVLVLPAGGETDEKVLLHELLHLRYRDAAWGVLICLLRCLHWCNPLLWYCAGRAGNDLEALCDQRVLERLEGEDRRDYGRILLGMAGEKYAWVPGTSSIANGGRNIRRRIEAIARFKKYPEGMALVSVCVVLVVGLPLLAGTRAGASDGRMLYGQAKAPFFDPVDTAMAAARTTRCTTYAGAMDAYAKALMVSHVPYRAMCAPLGEQEALAETLREEANRGTWGWPGSGLPGTADPDQGYRVYNLTHTEDGGREGVLVLALREAPAGAAGEPYYVWLAAQTIRAEREGDRWVVLPLEAFRAFQAYGWTDLPTSCDELPAYTYEARSGDFTLLLRRQTIAALEPFQQFYETGHGNGYFRVAPQPDGTFSHSSYFSLYALYTGPAADKGNYTHIAAACAPLREGQDRPVLQNPGTVNGGGGSTDGDSWGGMTLEPGWRDVLFLGGGGAGGITGYHVITWNGETRQFPMDSRPDAFPAAYAVDLYLNGALADRLTLACRGWQEGERLYD